MAATIASSLEAEQDSDTQTRFETTSIKSNDPPLSRVHTPGSGEDSMKLMELMALYTKLIGVNTVSHIKYALTESPIIYVLLIHQFWETASTSTSKNGKMEIIATIDGRLKTVTEASIRRHLKLQDSDGIPTLPNAEIFEQLALIGSKKTAWEQFSSNIATAIICLATNRTFNFSKMIFDGMMKNLDNNTKFFMYPRFIQILFNKHQRLLPPHKRTYTAPTLTHKLFSNMKRASKGYTGVDTLLFQTMIVQGQALQGEGSTIPIESHHTPTSAPSTSQPPTIPSSMQTTYDAEEPTPMPHDSSHPRKVKSLESDLKQTKLTYSAAYTKLVMRLKKLEKIVKQSKARRRTKIVILLDQEEPTELVEDLGSGEKGEKEISTANVTVTTAGAELSTVIPEVSTAAKNLVNIRRSAKKRKDKGKAIMQEDESVQKKTKKQLEQERLGHGEAIRSKEQINEEERQRIARDAKIAK
ncbi:hypothetical protein Tco_0265740 [Tanacetum coccineum]